MCLFVFLHLNFFWLKIISTKNTIFFYNNFMYTKGVCALERLKGLLYQGLGMG